MLARPPEERHRLCILFFWKSGYAKQNLHDKTYPCTSVPDSVRMTVNPFTDRLRCQMLGGFTRCDVFFFRPQLSGIAICWFETRLRQTRSNKHEVSCAEPPQTKHVMYVYLAFVCPWYPGFSFQLALRTSSLKPLLCRNNEHDVEPSAAVGCGVVGTGYTDCVHGGCGWAQSVWPCSIRLVLLFVVVVAPTSTSRSRI